MRHVGVFLFCVAVAALGWYIFVYSRAPSETQQPGVGEAQPGLDREPGARGFTTSEDVERSRKAAGLLARAKEAEAAGVRARAQELLREAASYSDTWAGQEATRRLSALAGERAPAQPTAAGEGSAPEFLPVSEPLPDRPPEKPDETYTVQPGDRLTRIARRLDTSVEQIKLANSKRDDLIHPGDRLIISWRMPTIIVDKEGLKLYLVYRGQVLRSYPIGVGRVDNGTGLSATPEGVFVIESKLKNPPWYRRGERIEYGHPRNILGTRWMGFRSTPELSGYGIHGTTQPETVPGRHTEGCIRMRNPDVEELFEWTPRGTRVDVRTRWRPSPGSETTGKPTQPGR